MATPNPLDEITEMRELVVGYARQETLEPLKRLGTYLGWGLGGSILMFLGTVFVAIGTLRLTQSIDQFTGSSWASLAPYAFTVVVLIVLAALIYQALSRAKKRVFS